MEPLVSIIIPTYNRATLIKETLDSIVSQSYTRWEAIVVDDGSTDGTEEIVLKSAEFDPRIKILKRNRQPKGAPTCRNIGIENSSGEYLVFLDSDDILAPWCLEERVKCIEDKLEVDFCVFLVSLFNKTPGDSKVLWNIFNEESDLIRFLRGDVPWQTSSPIWRRKAVEKLGNWKEGVLGYQDWEYHLRALIKKIRYLKFEISPDCYIRRDDTVARISTAYADPKQIESRTVVFTSIFHLLVSEGYTQVEKNLLFSQYFRLAEYCAFHYSYDRIDDVLSDVKRYKITDYRTFLLVKSYFYMFIFLRKSNIPFARGILQKLFKIFLPSYLKSYPSHLGKLTCSINK